MSELEFCGRCERQGKEGIIATRELNGQRLCGQCALLFTASRTEEPEEKEKKERTPNDQKITSGWKLGAPHEIDWKPVCKRIDEGETYHAISKELGFSITSVMKYYRMNKRNGSGAPVKKAAAAKKEAPTHREVTRPTTDSKHPDTGRSIQLTITGAALREIVISLYNSAEDLEKSEIAAYRSKAGMFSQLAATLDTKFAEEFEANPPQP